MPDPDEPPRPPARGEPDARLEEYYAIDAGATAAEFLAVAKVYAREVVERHDLSVQVGALDWEVSTRAKRRAGAVKHRDGDPEAVSLTWGHFESQGWEAAAATVRHELVHVHLLNEYGDATHGDRFRDLAERLETDVHCERFTEPSWWVVCTDCGARLPRYRRSKLVENVGDYRCGECGGEFRVEAGGDGG